MNLFAGIDFGSKLAGTTVICFREPDLNTLTVLQSKKKSDADHWLIGQIRYFGISKIFIDAPLSLPGVYSGTGQDYFYREADKKLGAMSPMFLGGLTARAMRLRSELEKENVECIEVYPAARIKRFPSLQKVYVKKTKEYLPDFVKILEQKINTPLQLTNWHQADAALAWWIGYDYMNDKKLAVGNTEEGVIYY